MLSNKKEESQEPVKSDRSGEFAIKSLRFRCVTLISNRNFAKVQAPESGHAGAWLSEKQLNEYKKAKWRAYATYLYRNISGSCIQGQQAGNEQ